jgi:hypothetical protein
MLGISTEVQGARGAGPFSAQRCAGPTSPVNEHRVARSNEQIDYDHTNLTDKFRLSLQC